MSTVPQLLNRKFQIQKELIQTKDRKRAQELNAELQQIERQLKRLG